jgi:hypothetical protein
VARRHEAACRPAQRRSKLSGLGTFIHRNDPEHIATIVKATLKLFGAERCLFGSNFPIEKLWTSYGELVEAHLKATSRMSKDLSATRSFTTRRPASTGWIRTLTGRKHHGTGNQAAGLRRHRTRIELSRAGARLRAGAPRAGLRLPDPRRQIPVLVDTGYRDNAIMESLGMRGLQFHENMIENQLAKFGLKVGDIRYICTPTCTSTTPARTIISR